MERTVAVSSVAPKVCQLRFTGVPRSAPGRSTQHDHPGPHDLPTAPLASARADCPPAGAHRYAVTDQGLRIALFFTRSYARVLRPGLSEVGGPELPQDTPLRRAFAQLERAMDQHVAQAK